MFDEDRRIFAFHNVKVRLTDREAAILSLLIKYEDGLYIDEFQQKLSYKFAKHQILSALVRIKQKAVDVLDMEKKKGEPYKIKKYIRKSIDK